MTALTPEAVAVIEGRHADPFRYLGPHVEDGVPVVRVFLPDARRSRRSATVATNIRSKRIHEAGLFVGPRPDDAGAYRLRVRFGDDGRRTGRPVSFPAGAVRSRSPSSGRGHASQLYDKLGAHPLVHEGVAGVAFAVFAPNAKRVSVVGDFNNWDGRRHAMRVRGNGFWEIFVPAVAAGDKYKFEILGADGKLLPLKSDPVAFAAELRPKTASIVVEAPTIDRPSVGAGRLQRRAKRRSRSMKCISARGGGDRTRAIAG